MMLLWQFQPNADRRMINCDEETKTQHYRGKWCGFGPIRNQEQIIFAVFTTTRRDDSRLAQDSFENRNLARKTQSVARASYITRAVFDREIAGKGKPTKGPLVGLACADVSKIRALRADIPTNNGTTKVAAICVLDLVEQGDYDGHATLGYATVTANGVNQNRLGTIRTQIRMDLADEFSEITQPNNRQWPLHIELRLKRVGSIARVVWTILRNIGRSQGN